MASWDFILTDLNFTPIGEILNAHQRNVSLPLNKTPTADFNVRLDHPLADVLLSTECYLKAYRTITGGSKQLKFAGPIITAAEEASGDVTSIAVNAAGPTWVFQHALVGVGPYGPSPSITTGDRAFIFKTLLSQVDSQVRLHMDTLTGPFTAASTATYSAQFKFMSDCLTDLSVSVGGFDWRVVLFEPTGLPDAHANYGRFEAYPVIGSTKLNAPFEWGVGRNNIKSYKRTVDRTPQANRIYHYTSAGPDAPGFPTVQSNDLVTATYNSQNKWGVLEDVAPGDISDATMRANLVEEHARVRNSPRQIIEFTPHIDPYDQGKLPQFGVDYDIGDSVPARARFQGKTRFDLLARVWGVSFAISDLGIEQQTLQLAM